MERDGRLYLDNAATSFPKPACVMEAMRRYAEDLGASPGRGSYRESVESGRLIDDCRARIVELVGGSSADHVVFTLNTTDALNLAIKGIVAHRKRTHPGEPVHLVTTELDHNSVLRPFNALRTGGVEWTCVEADPETGLVDPDAVAAALRPETALVAVVHASNASGTLQPIGRIGRACRARGVPLLVDAAQSLGHVPVDVEALCIDLLAFPGHKGLLGPLGTGGLYLRPGLEEVVDPLREGGTGTVSERDVHPSGMPEKYEAGSHNTIGIVGLGAGVGWLLERGMEPVAAHERGLVELVLSRLDGFEASGLRLLGPRDADKRVGVFSFVHEEKRADELARELESRFGVLVRAGIHCAPRAHAAFGSMERGGAVRMSVGAFVSERDLEYACRSLAEVAGAPAAV